MENPYYVKIAKYAFGVLFFFSLFGTDIPFSGGSVEQETSSSPINQLLYGTLFILAVICLIPRKSEFFRLVKDEKFLSMFLIFSLISMAWSDYSMLTFKRIFQLLTIFLTCAIFLLYVDDATDIIKPLKYILYPYLILTFIAIIAVPQARSGSFMWRGLTSNKNILGQIGVVSVILCYIFYKQEVNLFGKSLAIIMAFLSFVFTVGSQSSTSFLAVIFLLAFGIILSVDSIFRPLKIGRTISFLTIFSIFMVIIGIIWVFPSITEIVPELFGKDSSFSGRSELWNYLLTIGIKSINPVLGAGYGAFWVPESATIKNLYDIFTWIPLQAHNGYIEIFLSTGFIGEGLLIMLLLTYLINFLKIQKPHPWFLFILISLIINFQEATILRIGTLFNFIFMFSYLLLFVNKNKNFFWGFRSQINSD